MGQCYRSGLIVSDQAQSRRCSVFLVTVHDPICTDDGNLEAALYGSFLPVPSINAFPVPDPKLDHPEHLPGSIIAKKGRIVINRGRERIKIRVTNNGDRPIQVNRQLDCPPKMLISTGWFSLQLYGDEQGTGV